MKKRITLISLAVVALILVGLLSSLAFLTDKKDVTNTFTVGNIEIELEEPDYDVNGDGQKLLPGTVIDKDPTVTLLEGSEDAYIFMQIVPEGNIMDFLNAITVDTANWVAVTGAENLYVYSANGTDPAPVAATTGGTELPPLFSKIVVTNTLNNLSFNSFDADNDKLTVRAFAHQAEINGTADYTTAVDAAIDWAN